MPTNVLIVGVKGNMGRRYKAILDYYNIPNTGIDINEIWTPRMGISHVIITTPTDIHYHNILSYCDLNIPILCEKPISRFNVKELHEMFGSINLRMVNQYENLVDKNSRGESHYNYWNTGKDGLFWDCINIIGLSKEIPTINNQSPIWSCKINGETINIKDMDRAYMSMIFDWIQDPKDNWDYILSSHEKVVKLLNEKTA